MELSVKDELYARAIGWKILEYLRQTGSKEAVTEMERDALCILEKIRKILNDDSLDDPDCFQRIELIVNTFYTNGIDTSRHDWG